MFDPFAFVAKAAGGGGIGLGDSQSAASHSGDISGPRITFGSSAPGITTGQLALIVVGGLAAIYVFKKVG